MRDGMQLGMTLTSDLQQVVEYGLLHHDIKEVGAGAEHSDPRLPTSQRFRATIAYQLLEDLWLPVVRPRGSI